MYLSRREVEGQREPEVVGEGTQILVMGLELVHCMPATL